MIAPALLSAAVGLDRTAFAQSLLAHPVVAATTAGAIAGDLQAGLWTGVSLSVFSAEHIPVGETRVRDWASVAVATSFAVAHQDDATKGLLLLCAALCALPAGGVIRAARGVIRRMRDAVDDDSLVRSPGLGTRIQLAGLFLHAIRGAAVGFVLYLLLHFMAGKLQLAGALAAGSSLFWQLAAVAGLPVLFRIHVWPHLRSQRATAAAEWDGA